MLPCKPVEPSANQYATRDDFCRMFRKELDRLYGLLFLLTKDQAKAEGCFLAGFEDCMTATHVFEEFALSWARRALIQQAIRVLQPRPGRQRPWLKQGGAESIDFVAKPQWLAAMDGVSSLEAFERFVFVLSVLERYSEHECALLLSCSPRDIRKARRNALQQIAKKSSHQPRTEQRGDGGSFMRTSVHES
jgi:DNA-directed RNA polymerase specialized sigma24 family protein